MRPIPALLLMLVITAGVRTHDAPSQSFVESPDNTPPAPPSSDPNQQFGPPPAPAGGFRFLYGPPPVLSSGQGLLFGLPPPPSSIEYEMNPSPGGNSPLLFDDDCGYWKALSVVLLVGIGLTGLGLMAKVWPPPQSVFGGKDPASKLSDPAFVTSVHDKISDISRILTTIKEASQKDKTD